ncbi:MAG: PH domain-containing protein [Coriobacteriia bacterium]|nr:PH domain-containing protein [Coriobacteriia bacterium]
MNQSERNEQDKRDEIRPGAPVNPDDPVQQMLSQKIDKQSKKYIKLESLEGRSTDAEGKVLPGEHRSHIFLLVKKLLSTLLSMVYLTVFFFIYVFFGDFFQTPEGAFSLSDSQGALIAIGVLILFIVSIVFSVMSYKKNTWELTETGLRLRRNIVFKKDTHIPYEKIHAMNTQSGILKRILGLVDVEIDTGSSTTNVKIPALKLRDVEAMKAEIFKRKQIKIAKQSKPQDLPELSHVDGEDTRDFDSKVSQALDSVSGVRGIFAGDRLKTEMPVLYEYRLSNKELVLASFSQFSNFFAVIISLVLGSNIFGFLLEQYSEQIFLMLYSYTEQFSLQNFMSFIPFLLLGFLVFLLIVWFVSGIFNFFKLGGFKIIRRGDYFELSQGLLAQKTSTIALNRIQMLKVKQGFIRRIFGFAQISVFTVASISVEDDKEASANGERIVHPFIKLTDIPDFLNQTLPEFKGVYECHELEKLPKIALRKSVVRSIWVFALISIIIISIFTTMQNIIDDPIFQILKVSALSLALLLFIINLVSGILYYKNGRIGTYNKHYITVHGVLAKSMNMVNRNKFQQINWVQNPFQRYQGLATFSPQTAALSDADLSMKDITLDQANRILAWSKPVYSNLQFALSELDKQDLLSEEEKELITKGNEEEVL